MNSFDIEEFVNKHLMLIFLICLFVLILMYISQKIQKQSYYCYDICSNRIKDNNIKQFHNLYTLKQAGYFNGSITIKSTDIEYEYTLKDFFIKTAYNCFCSSGYRNGYVDECALKNCASYGVRALHMQIFSLDESPIVATNSLNTNHYKETYNEIKFSTALSMIDNLFRTGTTFPYTNEENNLTNDPLFLILQLHYGTNIDKSDVANSYYDTNKTQKKIIFYNRIYADLLNQFDMSHFASDELKQLYPNDYETNRDEHVANMKMGSLTKKIFIFVILNDGTSEDYSALKDSKLNNIVDLYGDNELNHYRSNELSTDDTLSKYTSRKELSFCMPDYTTGNANYVFVQAMKKGTQFIGMNFQKHDNQLNLYNEFFKSQHGISSSESSISSPYIKKPDHMIKLPLSLTI